MHSRIVACAVSVLVLPFGLLAQSEVASVKPNTTGNFGRLITYTADSLQATNVKLSSLIQSAYGIREDRWCHRRVDVEAINACPAGTARWSL